MAGWKIDWAAHALTFQLEAQTGPKEKSKKKRKTQTRNRAKECRSRSRAGPADKPADQLSFGWLGDWVLHDAILIGTARRRVKSEKVGNFSRRFYHFDCDWDGTNAVNWTWNMFWAVDQLFYSFWAFRERFSQFDWILIFQHLQTRAEKSAARILTYFRLIAGRV